MDSAKFSAIDFKDSAVQSAIAKLPRRPDLRQARQLQDVAMSAALILKEDLDHTEDKTARTRTGIALAQMIRAWNVARDGARIVRGRPLPGSLKPERKVKSKPKVSDEPSY